MTTFTDTVVVLHGPALHVASRHTQLALLYKQRQGIPLTTHDKALQAELAAAINATGNKRLRHNATHNSTTNEHWLTTHQLASILDVSERTIQRQALMHGGEKHKGHWRFPPPD